MSISILELERAQKMLDAFCTRQNGLAANPGRVLRCCRESGALIIAYADPFRAIVKLKHEEGGWRISVYLDSGSWQAYPPLPHADTIQDVIDEFERAPLHVHW